MDLWPTGLTRKPVTREPLEVVIEKFAKGGKTFRVFVANLMAKELEELMTKAQLPKGIRPDTPAAEDHAEKWRDHYIKTIILGWEGLTVGNLNAILRGEYVLEPDSSVPDDYEIPYSHERAVELWTTTLGGRFAKPVSDKVVEGADRNSQETDRKKAPSGVLS